MTSNLHLVSARADDRLSMAMCRRVRRVLLSPIDVFRANRQVVDNQLLAKGEPARWTEFDQARFERCRNMVETAEAALNGARSE